MRRAVTALALLLVLSVEIWSQSLPCSDPNATRIDTVNADLALAGSGIFWEYFVERSSSGQINYVINVSSIYLMGDGATIDAMTTTQIFDMISYATVAQGVALGHTSCPSSCSSPAYAVVKIPACVDRSGSGTGTHFSVCTGSGCCTRVYSVCCPSGNGAPVINLVNSYSPGCSGLTGCESTCP